MNYRIVSGLLIVGLAALIVAGCSDSDSPTGGNGNTDSEFEDYGTWTEREYTNAPSQFLGGAHQGNDPEYARRVFSSDDKARGAQDDYAEGTIFVKETYTYNGTQQQTWAEAGGLVAMKKRASGYDTDHGDWEYFMLDPEDLSVVDSGADLMAGACKGCHASATSGGIGEDYIFTHPTEYVIADGDFADFASWNEIDMNQGPDPALGDAHAGNDEDATRRVTKKQLNAHPGVSPWGYPTGTTVVKETKDGQGATIGMTAMVKRGGGFDSSNGNWEYFVLDTADASITARGTGSEVMGGACLACHGAANAPGAGMDYIFAHEDDPFNN